MVSLVFRAHGEISYFPAALFFLFAENRPSSRGRSLPENLPAQSFDSGAGLQSQTASPACAGEAVENCAAFLVGCATTPCFCARSVCNQRTFPRHPASSPMRKAPGRLVVVARRVEVAAAVKNQTVRNEAQDRKEAHRGPVRADLADLVVAVIRHIEIACCRHKPDRQGLSWRRGSQRRSPRLWNRPCRFGGRWRRRRSAPARRRVRPGALRRRE